MAGRRPRDLRAAATAGHNIIGSDTDQVIADGARRAVVVVAAWGHDGTLLGRERLVIETIPDLMCLDLTAKTAPAPAARPRRPTTRLTPLTQRTQRQTAVEVLASN